MFVALDHVRLATTADGDDDARRFFRDLPGFEEGAKPLPMHRSGGVWFRAGGVDLHLGVEADFRPVRKARPGLRVADIDAPADRPAASGLVLEWDGRYPRVRRFCVADP